MRAELRYCPTHGQVDDGYRGDTCPALACQKQLHRGTFVLENYVTPDTVYVAYTPLEAVLAGHALRRSYADNDDAVIKAAYDKTERANAAAIERNPDLEATLRAQIELMRLG